MTRFYSCMETEMCDRTSEKVYYSRLRNEQLAEISWEMITEIPAH